MKAYYTKSDDGSAILEIISQDFRFGLGVELDPNESGWWYVEKDMSKCASGLLPPEFQRLLTPRTPDRLWLARGEGVLLGLMLAFFIVVLAFGGR